MAVENNNGHYSNRGGYSERPQFWKELRRKLPSDVIPDKCFERLIKRDMPRIPRDGKTSRS